MLLLQKGDIDIARNLEADQMAALKDNPDVVVREVPKGAIYYLGLNQKNQYLSKPEVIKALKYLIPYREIADTIMKGSAVVHQTFLPSGFLGALDENPYKLDVEKAKELLKQAGLENGFKVTMDTTNSSPTIDMAQIIQATWAQGGHPTRDPAWRQQADADQVPRPHPRHLYRPLGPGLPGPEHQRLDLYQQSGQSRRGQADRQARLAERLGHSGSDRSDRGGRARAGQGQAGRDVP